ncbi:MAG: PilZ domain-containing protein [Pseudobdellovibrio sp.]|nr:PilZ domain-containing protein [Pseudobdellovibrio sp.]
MSAANTGNAGEFLVELEEKDAFLALHNCFTLNSDLILKNEADPNPVSAKIQFFADKKIFLETPQLDKLALFQGQTSIKFFIGTEVYFIKTSLEVVDDQICFDQSSKIVQLRRRKEPRYNIPEKWNQTAAVWSIELRIKNLARVTDISYGGCRFEVPKLSLSINKGDQIRIQYQIFKRADVVCDAIVRFIMRKPNGTTVLGLEFTQLQKSHKSRINNIVEDLVNHYAVKSLL